MKSADRPGGGPARARSERECAQLEQIVHSVTRRWTLLGHCRGTVDPSLPVRAKRTVSATRAPRSVRNYDPGRWPDWAPPPGQAGAGGFVGWSAATTATTSWPGAWPQSTARRRAGRLPIASAPARREPSERLRRHPTRGLASRL